MRWKSAAEFIGKRKVIFNHINYDLVEIPTQNIQVCECLVKFVFKVVILS